MSVTFETPADFFIAISKGIRTNPGMGWSKGPEMKSSWTATWYIPGMTTDAVPCCIVVKVDKSNRTISWYMPKKMKSTFLDKDLSLSWSVVMERINFSLRTCRKIHKKKP